MKKKYLITFGILGIVLFLAVSSCTWFMVRKISAMSAEELAKSISKQTGYVITIGKITPTWSGINLAFRVENISMYYGVAKEAFLQVKAVEGKLNFWQTIRNLTLSFSKIKLDTPKLLVDIAVIKAINSATFSNKVTSNNAVNSLLKIGNNLKGLSIVNGAVKLVTNNAKGVTIKNINLAINYLGKYNYKLQGNCNIASMQNSKLIVTGDVVGNFINFQQLRAMMHCHGENLVMPPELQFLAVKLGIKDAEIANINTTLMLQQGKLTQVAGELQLTNIILADNSKVPKVKIHAKYLTTSNKINFQIEDLAYDKADIFANVIYIPIITGKITWETKDNKILFNIVDLVMDSPETTVKADINFSYQAGNINDLTLHLISEAITVEVARKYLPIKILPAEVNNWLLAAIRQGIILSNSLIYRDGKFDWIMNFKEVTLAYAPNWPEITEFAGNLHLTEKQITISGISGKILNTPLGMFTANIEDLDKEQIAPLIIEGEVNATLAQGIKFLCTSPLTTIGQTLNKYKPQGNMQLNLQLNMPLTTETVVPKIKGQLLVQQGTLLDTLSGITFTNITGNINFTETTISSDKLKLQFEGQQGIATLNYDEAKSPLLTAILTANLPDKALLKLFPILATVKLQGNANFTITNKIPINSNEQQQLSLNSMLEGMSFELLPILSKKQAEKKEFALIYQNNTPASFQLKYTDNFYSKVTVKNHKIQENTLQALELLMQNLTLFNNKFQEMSLLYDAVAKTITIGSEKIIGVIDLANKQQAIKLIFEKINLAEVKQENFKISPKISALKVANLPAILCQVDDLVVGKNIIGKVNLQLLPTKFGYDIADLTVKNNAFNLQGSGKWELQAKQNSHLSGKITGNNIGKLFEHWGFGRAIKRGKGEMQFNFTWDGDPLTFNMATAVGEVELQLATGQIRGINPGFGRFIGLLNLDNILKLDFRDLMSKGFVFDSLQTKCQFNNGILHTDGLFIDGHSAYIALAGDADLSKKTIDFKMGVMPKLGASLPLAAAITASNPVIGGAFWVLNKATNSKKKDKDVVHYDYKITGTWEQPTIIEIKEKNRK